MKRFRVFAAILGCLAILAGGFMMAAAAASPLGAPALDRSAIGEQPCSHCNDCGGAACPTPSPACVQSSVNAGSTLAIATFDLPAVDFSKIRWLLRVTALNGLSPPPDPFPPRA